MTVAAQSYGGGSSSASSPVGAPTWFGGVLSSNSKCRNDYHFLAAYAGGL